MRQNDGTSGASATNQNTVIQSLDELVPMSVAQLESIYRGAVAGDIPVGNSKGRAIFFAGTFAAVPLSKVARVCWQGKIFRADRTLINKGLGFLRIAKAKLYQAESWLDGKPATIIDYSETSVLVGGVRDEIREIQPHVYLGIAYLRNKSRTVGCWFALDLRHEH